MTVRRLACGAALALALAGCGASVLPIITAEADRVDAARTLMAKRDFFPAIELLKTFIARNGGSSDVDAAVCLLGECYVGQKEWASAEIEFERLLRDYPESDSAAAASFLLGLALNGQSRGADFDQEFTTKALEQWQRYLASYPDHWRHGEAVTRVAQLRSRLATKLLNTGLLYLKLNEPSAARVYFERVDHEFADTPVVGEAWIGLARADILTGQRERGIARLRSLEETFEGQPLGTRAAEERRRAEKARVKAPPTGHRIPEQS